MSSPDNVASLERRGLLVGFFWTAIALVSSALSVPIVGYIVGPLLRVRRSAAVRVAPIADLPLDRPQRVEFVQRRRDGWVTEGGRRSAWVVRRTDGVRVFDPRCTHLGCAYHWHAQTGQFLCPCHNGLYDIDGRVVGGPPPRPLDSYESRVEDGVLYIIPIPQQSA